MNSYSYNKNITAKDDKAVMIEVSFVQEHISLDLVPHLLMDFPEWCGNVFIFCTAKFVQNAFHTTNLTPFRGLLPQKYVSGHDFIPSISLQSSCLKFMNHDHPPQLSTPHNPHYPDIDQHSYPFIVEMERMGSK